jgi:hypothetical protein
MKQRIILHDVKAIKALHVVLLEEKQCRDALAVVVKKNPVDCYEEYRLELEHARRLGFDTAREPLMADAQRLFDSVKDRIEVRRHVFLFLEGAMGRGAWGVGHGAGVCASRALAG